MQEEIATAVQFEHILTLTLVTALYVDTVVSQATRTGSAFVDI